MFGNTALVHELPHLPVFRHTHRQTLTRIQRPFGPAVPADQQRCYRRSQRCQAEERSRDSTKTKETEKTVVPDTPPAQDSPARRSSDSGTSTATEDSVEVSEELKLLQQRKRDSQASAPANYFEAVSQEARLIEWPKPKQAVTNTVLVIGVVGVATVFLLLLNSTLAEITKLAYTR